MEKAERKSRMETKLSLSRFIEAIIQLVKFMKVTIYRFYWSLQQSSEGRRFQALGSEAFDQNEFLLPNVSQVYVMKKKRLVVIFIVPL